MQELPGAEEETRIVKTDEYGMNKSRIWKIYQNFFNNMCIPTVEVNSTELVIC